MREPRSDPAFHLYLLLGQSNMAGTPPPEPCDRVRNPRVYVLCYADCAAQEREYGRWSIAVPPLHGCDAGLGPGDGFGRVVADAYPDARIGLIPCAIAGVDIDYYRKGVVSARRHEFRIPPDNHWSGAYEWVVERARLAQRSGVIRGILLHQGESDSCDPAWPGKIKEIVGDLRSDLGLGDVPLVAGELLHGGVCAEHNALVNELPRVVPNTYVASASGLGGMDAHHFDLDGQRELGRRFGERMLVALAS